MLTAMNQTRDSLNKLRQALAYS